MAKTRNVLQHEGNPNNISQQCLKMFAKNGGF